MLIYLLAGAVIVQSLMGRGRLIQLMRQVMDCLVWLVLLH